ncbi:MAG: hypothetical protein V4534_03805 [Myxococcota bacterium]
MRRNLFAIGFSFALLYLGIWLWMQRELPAATVLSLSFIFGLFIILFAVVVIFVWRNRGTLHLDEIRELRG